MDDLDTWRTAYWMLRHATSDPNEFTGWGAGEILLASYTGVTMMDDLVITNDVRIKNTLDVLRKLHAIVITTGDDEPLATYIKKVIDSIVNQ